jgi:hypothetical protein
MLVHDRLCAFAAGLESLLAARDSAEFEATWERHALHRVGWEALALARRADSATLEPVLSAVDHRLLAVLERCRAFLDPHVVTFRIPELERWQHAAAAALVGARWGAAGLKTVIADVAAPLGRRYFAFLALAERHPAGAWPVFARYLSAPGAHHAFLAAAAEAARYYPGHAPELLALFERIRADELLRRFLGPKILESLYVLGDAAALPLFEAGGDRPHGRRPRSLRSDPGPGRHPQADGARGPELEVRRHGPARGATRAGRRTAPLRRGAGRARVGTRHLSRMRPPPRVLASRCP